MVIDYSRFQNLDSDVDSDEEIHPNIDKKSWLKMRREQRLLQKQHKISRLNELESLGETPELLKEKESLIKELSPKIKEVASSSTNYKQVEVDYTENLVYLINNSTLPHFNEHVKTHNLCLESFEEFVLLNLSENIKEGNDEGARILANISLYLKYARSQGISFMHKLEESLKIGNNMEIFKKESEDHFLECKNAILALNNDKI